MLPTLAKIRAKIILNKEHFHLPRLVDRELDGYRPDDQNPVVESVVGGHVATWNQGE